MPKHTSPEAIPGTEGESVILLVEGTDSSNETTTSKKYYYIDNERYNIYTRICYIIYTCMKTSNQQRHSRLRDADSG